MRIQPEAKHETGSGKRRAQRSAKAEGGPTTIAPAKSPFEPLSTVAGCRSPRSMPCVSVIVAELRQRAVDVDRPVVAGFAQQPDHPLRLAERIGADEMRAFGKLLDRFQQLGRSRRVSGGWRNTGRPKVASVMKTSQATGSKARRSDRAALVVARGDDAHAALLDSDLRRAEHVAGRDES